MKINALMKSLVVTAEFIKISGTEFRFTIFDGGLWTVDVTPVNGEMTYTLEQNS